MNAETVRTRIQKAVDVLLERDMHLLEVNANERSITHRLGCYLQEEFDDWDVDCEYNRNGPHPKRVDDIAAELGGVVAVDDTNGRTVFPDVIVHRRGLKKNLLVIEVKKTSWTGTEGVDREKLRLYRDDPRLEYEYCVELVLGVGAWAGEVPVFEFLP